MTDLHDTAALLELHVEYGDGDEWRIVTAWQNTDRHF